MRSIARPTSRVAREVSGYFAHALKLQFMSRTVPASSCTKVGAESRSQTRSLGTRCSRTLLRRRRAHARCSVHAARTLSSWQRISTRSYCASTRAISAYTHGIGPSLPGQSGSWCGQAIQVASCGCPLGGEGEARGHAVNGSRFTVIGRPRSAPASRGRPITDNRQPTTAFTLPDISTESARTRRSGGRAGRASCGASPR